MEFSDKLLIKTFNNFSLKEADSFFCLFFPLLEYTIPLHFNAPDGKVKLVEFIQKQATAIEGKLLHTEKLKIVVQHEIDVASQKLDYELLNNRKQAIANTVKELLGKHQDPNLKKAYLDLVTDYANELTQPKCEKHGIPTQRKTHALTIDKISEIIRLECSRRSL